MVDKKKTCPILSLGVNFSYCLKEECALWSRNWLECGLLGITKALNPDLRSV